MWQEDLARELTAARHSERGAVIDRFAHMTGKSRACLYAIAAEYGFCSGRKARADKGTSLLTDGQVEFVASLIYTMRREVKGPISPVEAALEVAFDNDIIKRGSVSVGRMQQILRERQMNKAALMTDRPYTPLRSLHPNYCHVFDVSVCVQYYLKGGKGLRIMDERDFYKNKLDNYLKIKTRLLRYVLVDHFSGAFYLSYFNTTGETQNNLYTFLRKAWGAKNDEKYPFRGVPLFMLMDTGAANSSGAIVQFMERLGITLPKGMPYNAARQGTVEVMHNVIEQWFESKLRLSPAQTIEDLNAWAYDFLVWCNAKREHSRHGMPRTQSWLQITEEQLRELPATEILQALYSYTKDDYYRTVNRDYSITFALRGEKHRYNVKHVEGILPGRSKVLVVIKPFVYPVIDVLYNEKTYEVHPLVLLPAAQGGFRADAAIIGQEYKAQPETPTQQAIKRFENRAYGEERRKDAVPFEGLRVMGIHAEKVDIAYIERKGTAMEFDRAVADADIPLGEFLMRLKAEIGDISMALNQQLRTAYGASIAKKTAEEVIEHIKAGTWPAGGVDQRQAAIGAR